jgi:hypothetical protein
MNISRRIFMGTALFSAAGLTAPSVRAAPKSLVRVWKGPSCECCDDWIQLLRRAGFDVEVSAEGNSDARARLGLPLRYGSCHTAQVAGYAIEGHVPVRDIQRLLQDRPKAVGLAVPGMPIGSPGMDGPQYGSRRDAYDVLLIDHAGQSRIYTSYR